MLRTDSDKTHALSPGQQAKYNVDRCLAIVELTRVPTGFYACYGIVRSSGRGSGRYLLRIPPIPDVASCLY